MTKKNDDKILNFNGITRLDIPPARILKGAQKWGLESVVILGWDKNGEAYFSSSMADGGDVLWLMRKCELALLRGGFDE